MSEWNILSKLFIKMSKSNKKKMKLIYLTYPVTKLSETHIGIVSEVIDRAFVKPPALVL